MINEENEIPAYGNTINTDGENDEMISSEALQKLIEGNKRYIESGKYSGDV